MFDNKFILLDCFLSKRVFKESPKTDLEIIDPTFHNLYKFGKLKIGNYLESSDGFYQILELSEGYYVQFFYKPTNKMFYKVISSNGEIEIADTSSIDNLIDKIDYLNINTHLFVNARFIGQASRQSDLDFVTFSSNSPYVFWDSCMIKAYFSKYKYSPKEMEYWAQVCLKIFIYFYKRLEKAFVYANKLSEIKDKNQIINQYTRYGGNTHVRFKKLMVSEIKRLSEIGATLFLIDGCINYSQERVKINREKMELCFLSTKDNDETR